MTANKPIEWTDPGAWAQPQSSPRLVVIAASAGGLAAVRRVLAVLPADFPAAIALVQHRGLQHPQLLPELLASWTRLQVRHAQDGELLAPGVVYVCPPGMHMTAEHCLRLVEGPKLDYVRPSADLMFRSAARAYADRALAVVLSGKGTDGALGCLAITQVGGVVIVQDPETCESPDMPAAAAQLGAHAMVLPPERIGAVLQQLVEGPWQPMPAPRHAGHRLAATRVLLADDHRIMLDGLRGLLRSEQDMEVVGEAHDGRAAVRLSSELAADVVVMDIAMPHLDGIAATRQIVQTVGLAAPAKVVVLSAFTDERTVQQILRAGASAYLTKQTAFAELVTAIRAVTAGEMYRSPDIMGTTGSAGAASGERF